MISSPRIKKALNRLANRARPRFLIMAAGIALALYGFEEIVDDVFHDPLEGDFEAQSFDRAIGGALAGIRTEWLTQVMTDLTALGSVSVIVVLFVVFATVLASFRDYKGIAFIGIVLAGGGLWPSLLKTYFARPRPPSSDFLVNALDLSFPSGHTFGATAAYIGFAYYAGRYAKSMPQELFFYFLAGILVVLVGASRIYLGVHYPTDVLAGLCGGTAWGLSALAAYEKFSPVRAERAKPE